MEASEIEALKARLEAAERTCVLLGWYALPDDSERGKAVLQAWMDWSALPGVETGPAAHRDLEALIPELARRRDETRARTLDRIRELGS